MTESVTNNKEQQLLKQLESLPIKNHSIWGHGTVDLNTARSILEKGVIANPSYDLTEIATPINQGDSNEGIIKGIWEKAREWKHKNSKYIILVVISNGLRKDQVIELFDQDGQKRTRLPNRFVYGFIDVINLNLVVNSEFDKNAESTDGKYDMSKVRPKSRQSGEIIVPKTINSLDETDDIW